MNYRRKYFEDKNEYLNFKLYRSSVNGMRILFDPDENQLGGKLDKDSRTNYLELCNQLTSRKAEYDYPKITESLLEIILKDVTTNINDLKYDEEKKKRMQQDLNHIFGTIEKDDTNYIGKINVVLLQCIILFTKNCIDPNTKFKVNLNNAYHYYTMLSSDNWKNYSIMKNKLMNADLSGQFNALYLSNGKTPYTTTYTTTENSNNLIYLITIVDYLSLDEINNSFLNNVIFCGMTYEFQYADGRFLTPFEFLEHDITHGNNYEYACYGRMDVSRDKLISFYNFCKDGHLQKADEYSIKFLIFLLVHESFCDFFPNINTSISKNSVMSSILNTGALNMSRFINSNDLGLSIPKNYRGDKDKIESYLSQSADIYIREFDKWRNDELIKRNALRQRIQNLPSGAIISPTEYFDLPYDTRNLFERTDNDQYIKKSLDQKWYMDYGTGFGLVTDPMMKNLLETNAPTKNEFNITVAGAKRLIKFSDENNAVQYKLDNYNRPMSGSENMRAIKRY